MHTLELTPLLRLPGVRGVALVDEAGLVILEVGYMPELLPAHVAQINSAWRLEGESPFNGWREVHADGWKLLLAPSELGTLCLIADENANLGRIRIAAIALNDHLLTVVKQPFKSLAAGGGGE